MATETFKTLRAGLERLARTPREEEFPPAGGEPQRHRAELNGWGVEYAWEPLERRLIVYDLSPRHGEPHAGQ